MKCGCSTRIWKARVLVLLCGCDQIPWQKQLGRERGLFPLTAPDCGPLLHRRANHIPTAVTSREKYMYSCPLAYLCSARFLHSSTGQERLPGEWCHPQWAWLSISFKLGKTIPTDMPHSQTQAQTTLPETLLPVVARLCQDDN